MFLQNMRDSSKGGLGRLFPHFALLLGLDAALTLEILSTPQSDPGWWAEVLNIYTSFINQLCDNTLILWSWRQKVFSEKMTVDTVIAHSSTTTYNFIPLWVSSFITQWNVSMKSWKRRLSISFLPYPALRDRQNYKKRIIVIHLILFLEQIQLRVV